MRQFQWTPGIGDPSVLGWATVVLYLATVVVCVAVVRHLDGTSSREITMWRVLAALFLALGINKQLDLQSALTEFGRVLAADEGWYERRAVVQTTFVIFILIVCAAFGAALFRSLRDAPASARWAVYGTVVLLAFIAMRAASFHHFDAFIGSRILGARWNWILEIGGISMVLISGLVRVSSLRAGAQNG